MLIENKILNPGTFIPQGRKAPINPKKNYGKDTNGLWPPKKFK
jgi:hypothetical protein